MTKSYQWYYDGSAIGGATGKTHTLTSGQTDSDRIECRVEVDYGADTVAALAEYAATGGITIVGWGASNFQNAISFSTLSAPGSASGTGDGGTVQENDIVYFFHTVADNAARTTSIGTTGYTQVVTDLTKGTPAPFVRVGVWRKVMGATPDTEVAGVYSGSGSAAQPTMCIVVRGVDTTTPEDVSIVEVTEHGTVDPDPGAITPVTTGALILAYGAAGHDSTVWGGTLTKGANMTLVGNSDNADTYDAATALAYYDGWTSGAFDPDQFTGTTATGVSGNVAVTIALRPA